MSEPNRRASADDQGSSVARFFQALERFNHVARTVPAYFYSWIRELTGSRRARIRTVQEEEYVKRALQVLDIPALTDRFYRQYQVDERFETVERDEIERIDELAKLIATGTMYRQIDLKKADASTMALRRQHAKQHGCVDAKFVVDPELSNRFAAGVFKPGQSYCATLRFSNAHSSPRHDRRGDGRGLAIKLRLGTELMLGHPISDDGKAGDPGNNQEQDFLLTDFPVFIVDNIDEYERFLSIVEARGSSVMTLLRIFFFFFPFRLRKGWIFLRISRNTIESPLAAEYHSMSPYLLGDSNVVRYIVKPSGDGNRTPAGASHEENCLRERLADELALRNTDKNAPSPVAAFDFCVQVRDNPTSNDVEQCSRPWRGETDQIVRLARIEIPPQDFNTQSVEYRCQNLVFSPWNCLREHRPLGGINRSRLLVYFVSAELRHRLNMVAPGC